MCKIVCPFGNIVWKPILGSKKMEARINLIIFVLICFTGLASVALAQAPATLPSTDTDANVVSIPSFPYAARIIADDVYIRSGPGTNFYQCGKLYKTDTVTVVGSHFSWSRIVPPPGSFSWISARYVTIDPDNPNAGIVKGNAVRVYVGAEDRDPIRSTRMQLKLNRGEKVTLLGELKSDYHKIAPPTGAYRWVSTRYTEPLSPVVTPPPPVVPPSVPTTPVVPTETSGEDARLRQYYALQKQMYTERNKPMDQQNYADIKKALLEIAADKQAGKGARYAQFAIKQVRRFELALEVANTVRLQDAHFQRIKDDIAKARAARLAEAQDLGRFAVMGRLQTSNIYLPDAQFKYYRIINDSGRTLCYTLPTGPASRVDLAEFVGRKVGLIGTIEPHLQTAGALVRFTEIVQLR